MSAREQRKRVLILGGGFAGIGAARKLKDADVDVVLVDRTTTTRSSPCSTRSRPACSTPRPWAILCATSFHDQRTAVHRDTVTAIDLEARDGRSSRSWRRSPTTTSCSGSAPRSTSSGSRAPRSTRSRCTPCPTPAAQGARPAPLGGGRPRPALVDDGALNVVVVGGGATGLETVGRARGAVPRGSFARTTRSIPQEQARIDPRRGRAGALRDVQAGHPPYTMKALEKRGVEVMSARSSRRSRRRA